MNNTNSNKTIKKTGESIHVVATMPILGDIFLTNILPIRSYSFLYVILLAY
jgi:hypothetical protein